MKRVLITGKGSYIGESVKSYLLEFPEKYSVEILDTIGWNPKEFDFTNYDVVFNAAGIAHIKETKKNRHLYYEVNRDLAINIAKAAKKAGVKQYILLSSMSVYGLVVGHINKSTVPHPRNSYGDSKLQADEAIQKLVDDSFIFTCLRPPMVYGKNCKGNYQTLRKYAVKFPVFPNYNNQRSMIYIGNLCEFVKNVIDDEMKGLFFPQNAEYSNTSEIVRLIAESNGKKIKLIKLFNWIIKLFPITVLQKVFGNLTYDKVDIVSLYSFPDSIVLTEGY